MILSEWQVQQVENRIEESGIGIEELKHDLLDHLCCCIETDMDNGLSFEIAIRRAFLQVCPNGINEIETETILLLNKTICQMKKITYTSGLIASVFMIVGSLMKFLHWSDAGPVFAIGLLLFVFAFIPMYLFPQLKNAVNSTQKAASIAGITGALITGAGVSFKILHYPGADVLTLTGISILTFCLLPFVFYTAYKNAA